MYSVNLTEQLSMQNVHVFGPSLYAQIASDGINPEYSEQSGNPPSWTSPGPAPIPIYQQPDQSTAPVAYATADVPNLQGANVGSGICSGGTIFTSLLRATIMSGNNVAYPGIHMGFWYTYIGSGQYLAAIGPVTVDNAGGKQVSPFTRMAINEIFCSATLQLASTSYQNGMTGFIEKANGLYSNVVFQNALPSVIPSEYNYNASTRYVISLGTYGVMTLFFLNETSDIWITYVCPGGGSFNNPSEPIGRMFGAPANGGYLCAWYDYQGKAWSTLVKYGNIPMNYNTQDVIGMLNSINPVNYPAQI